MGAVRRRGTEQQEGTTVAVTGPAGSDPDFEVYSGRLLASSDGLGTSESSSVGLLAGDNVVVINDYNNSSASTCFTVTIN